MVKHSRHLPKNNVLFFEETHLRQWVSSLEKIDYPYFPRMDESWFKEMMSCVETARIVPECRENVYRAAARIFYKVIKNHYRFDGNKRSSIIVIILFFFINDLEVIVQQDFISSLAEHIAADKSDSEQMIRSLAIIFEDVDRYNGDLEKLIEAARKKNG